MMTIVSHQAAIHYNLIYGCFLGAQECARVSPEQASCAFVALAKIGCIIQHFLGLPEVN